MKALLLLFGAGLLLGGVLKADAGAVAATAIVMGTGLVLAGAFYHRVTGPFQLSPSQGLKLELTDVKTSKITTAPSGPGGRVAKIRLGLDADNLAAPIPLQPGDVVEATLHMRDNNGAESLGRVFVGIAAIE